ncbi:hypothetical protein YC2023_113149 [Brassica napus]|uniref:Uncharacterized protein n=1 Tax=Brassica oleracea TaxID=3712 RepID=A0A3P6E9A0_BRAOL|nr:unnamed protein product [Brassica oleracea]
MLNFLQESMWSALIVRFPPQLAPDWVLPALRRRSLREPLGLSSAFQHRFSLLFDS